MKKKLVLKYNKSIYPEHAIKKAISDYSKIAKLGFSKQKNHYQIEMSEFQKDLGDQISDEFSNHVLSLIES